MAMSTVKNCASVCTAHQRMKRPSTITIMPTTTNRQSREASWPSSRIASHTDNAMLAPMTTMSRSSVPRSRVLFASPERRRPIQAWLTAQTMHSATKACASVMGGALVSARLDRERGQTAAAKATLGVGEFRRAAIRAHAHAEHGLVGDLGRLHARAEAEQRDLR